MRKPACPDPSRGLWVTMIPTPTSVRLPIFTNEANHFRITPRATPAWDQPWMRARPQPYCSSAIAKRISGAVIKTAVPRLNPEQEAGQEASKAE